MFQGYYPPLSNLSSSVLSTRAKETAAFVSVDLPPTVSFLVQRVEPKENTSIDNMSVVSFHSTIYDRANT